MKSLRNGHTDPQPMVSFSQDLGPSLAAVRSCRQKAQDFVAVRKEPVARATIHHGAVVSVQTEKNRGTSTFSKKRVIINQQDLCLK
jgi:hypothetical protein